MAYKGKYKLTKPEKYIGDGSKIWFRSLWELSAFKYLENNPDVKNWSSEVEIKYINDLDGKPHRYYVDLYILYTNGSVKLVEIKPKKQTIPPPEPKRKTVKYITECQTYITNTSKWKAAQKICDQRGYSFEIWTEVTLKNMGIKIIT
jgi:hypothetical protein